MIQKIKKALVSYKKTRQDKMFRKFIGVSDNRTYYNLYGKVIRLVPKKIMKTAFIVDTFVPLTFFIPVILAGIFYIITMGRTIEIIRED